MIAPSDCDAIAGRPPSSLEVGGEVLRAGSRVRLRPAPGGDVFAWKLCGRTARIEGFDQDDEGRIHVAITLEDDPGRDLGESRFPGHRFYFSPAELEPLADGTAPRILIAGIGNVFLGDDGFGVAVSRRLMQRGVPPAVHVIDFGIRGIDLAYALLSGYDAVVLIDACARGTAPGTLCVIEPEGDAPEPDPLQAHSVHPEGALALARRLALAEGKLPPSMPVRIVGCEPARLAPADAFDTPAMQLSPEVNAVLPAALELVDSVIADLAAALRTNVTTDAPAAKETQERQVRNQAADAVTRADMEEA